MKGIRLYIVFFYCVYSINTISSQTDRDSLLTFIRTDKEDTNKVIHLYKLCYEFDATGEYAKGLEYGKQSLRLAQTLNYKKGIGNAYSNIGIIFDDLGNFPEALKNYKIALKIRRDIKDKRGIAACLNNIGEIFRVQGNYQEALRNYFEALKLFEEIDFKFGIASAFNNIGTIYKALKNYPQALKFYNSSYDIKLQINDKRGIVAYFGNVASLYEAEGKLNEAIKSHLAGLKIAEEIGDVGSKALSYNHLGKIHLRQLQFKEADNYLQLALSIEREIEDKKGMATSYLYLSDLNLIAGYFDKARVYANNAFDLGRNLGNKSVIAGCYENLSVLDSISGDFKGAFQNYKMLIRYQDSLVTEESKKISVEANMQYEFDKKEMFVKAHHDKIVYQLEADNRLQKQWRTFFILVIILTCVGLFFAKRAYDNKKKIAEFMASESNRKEVLLQEVHHRINNNLQIISSLLTLQANSADDEKLTAYLKQSQNRIQSLSVLHELLYQSDSPLQIKMNDYLNKVLDFHRDVLTTLTAKVEIKMKVTDAVFPTKMAVPLALIVNELVTNAIKYAFKDADYGKIVISLEQIEDKQWLLKVSDSGKGLPEDTNFRKDSLGLRLVNIMTKQIKGTLTQYNKDGATFELRFTA